MPLFIKVPVPTQENERSRIYILERSICLLDFGIVPTTKRMTCYVIDNRNVDIKISVYDAFL